VIAKVAVPIGIAVAVIGGIVTTQLVVVVHRGCTVQGQGSVNGDTSISTDCGDFDTNLLGPLAFSMYDGPIDVTVQGWTLLPPQAIAVAIAPHR
jgi:hypothetical protein